MGIRIAHIADLHLGYNTLSYKTQEGQNQREADVERSAMAIADKLIELKPDLVALPGDITHETRISTRGLDGVIRFGRRLTEAGLETIVSPGNHDEAEGEQTFSMLELLRHAGVQIYFEQATVDIAGVRLHLVPYRTLSRARRGRIEIADFDFSPTLPNVLMAHGTVEGVMPDEVLIPKLWIDDPRFELVMLGHIHQHRQLNERAFYSGAIERLGFGEEPETPAFWIHEIEDGKLVASESVTVESLGLPLTPRPMWTVEVDCNGLTLDDVASEVQRRVFGHPEREGALARLILTDVPAAFLQTRMRRDWEEGFRDGGGLHLQVNAETRVIGEYFDLDMPVVPTDVAGAFHEFLDMQDLGDLDERNALIELADEVLGVAKEKLAREAER